MKRFLFLILLLPTVLTAQWRMVSSSVSLNSTVDDSTYVIDVDFFSDLTGGGYLATGITADFLVFSQTGELYDITAATNLTLSSGRLTIVEVDNEYVNTEGAPTGQILVYDPQGEYIPVTPFGNTNMGNVLQGAAIAYNSRVKNQISIATLGDTSTIINPYEGQLVYVKDAGNYQVRGAYAWNALDPGGGAVSSVNTQTGAVVLDADDIDDTSTTNKFTSAGDISKLAGVESGATADQTAAEIRDALETLSGASRLDASAIQNIPSSSGGYYVSSVSEPDTSLLWIDENTFDGTTVYRVKDYVGGQWSTIGWYDDLGKVFSKEEPLYLVLTGQSNSQARGTFEVGVNVTADTIESTYNSIWNYQTSQWELLDVKKAFLTASKIAGTTSKVWWGTTIGQEAEKAGRITKYVYHGEGGRTINGWTTYDNNDGTVTLSGVHWDTLSTAINNSAIPRIDGVIWYQGETDGSIGRSVNSYKTDWLAVRDQFRALTEWTPQTKLIACQISAGGTQEKPNEFFNALAIDGLTDTYVAENNYAIEADSSHIKGGGHVILGRRLWDILNGENIYNPQAKYSLSALSADTVDLDFSHSTIQIDAYSSVVVNSFTNVVNGWSGNIRFRGTAGVTALPDRMFCESITGATVQIDTFLAPYFTHASIINDSLFCTVCPEGLKVGLPTPLELGAYAWYDVSNTSLSEGATLDTLRDLSGNSIDLPGFNTPTIRKNVVNALAAVELRDSAYFRGGGNALSRLHDGPSTIFAIINVRDSIDSNSTLIGNHGNSSSHLGYGWVVINSDSLDGSYGLVHYIGRGGGGIVVSGTYPSVEDNRYSMIWVKSDPENVTANQRSFFRENNESVASTNSQTASVSGTEETFFSIGRNLLDNYADFNFSEIIIFDSILSDSEITEVENYLSNKYNLIIN